MSPDGPAEVSGTFGTDIVVCSSETTDKQTFHLTADENDRDTIRRMLRVYADSYPIAWSVKDSIEISSELDLNTR